MDTAYSLSDLASVMNNENGWGGNSAWLIILFVLIFGWGGNGYRNGQGEFGQYATAASQNEILLGQKFDALSRQINQVGDGLCSSTYALNNSIQNEGRAIQSQLSTCCCENQRNTDALRYDMAQQFASSNANTTAQTQKILDAICQNKIDTLQSQVGTLQNQLALQQAMCGVPKINPYMYGIVPTYSGCGCNSAI